MIANIGGIERSWRVHGPEITATALSVLAKAFDGQILRYAGTLFPGLAAVCAQEMTDGARVRPFDSLMLEMFVEIAGDVDQIQWRKDITLHRADQPNQRYDAASGAVFLKAWAEFCEEFLGDGE